ncbi:MAG: [FeFe] hydrogenase H-cluster radical SAM maturase HydE [Mailhella sp.]|nr:[FeFe] hydrogenase H-cluster radical SAM maturase HydE [Mailhella sp.]
MNGYYAAYLGRIWEGGSPIPELAGLIARLGKNTAEREALFEEAREAAVSVFGKSIYMRGLIEFTDHCKNDCLYCGIRRSNKKARRYRLSREDILASCETGYGSGFRTFVLQGGEDAALDDDFYCSLLGEIKNAWPDSAVTLSIGERSRESYAAYRRAGADRYLLRHESADPALYALWHPPFQRHADRMRCLADLKGLGYQTGIGFMVGAPFQTDEHLAEELLFIRRFGPAMVGLGPFIPHADTPFGTYPAGSAEKSLIMLALTRLIDPRVLLPATTALGSVEGEGRERGILAGCNVLMPNISPPENRANYSLYNNKVDDGSNAEESCGSLSARVRRIGYSPVVSRGDYQGKP